MDLIWVTEAKYVKDYKIELIFNDGLKNIVDLKSSIKGKVFEPLKSINYKILKKIVGQLSGIVKQILRLNICTN